MHQVRTLARRSAALPLCPLPLPVACWPERLRVPGIKCAYEFLAGQAKAMQIAYSLIGSPVR